MLPTQHFPDMPGRTRVARCRLTILEEGAGCPKLNARTLSLASGGSSRKWTLGSSAVSPNEWTRVRGRMVSDSDHADDAQQTVSANTTTVVPKGSTMGKLEVK
jgi:hypothetical protein